MSRDVVAQTLTEYAITNVSLIQQEYNAYMIKWQSYLDMLADAHTAALDKVQHRFDKIRQEEREAREFVMMALSVIGVAGTAWLGAMVEMVWAKKLFGKVEVVETVEQDVFGRNIWKFGTKIEFSEVVAKTMGDSIHELTGHALDKLFEKVLPESKAQMDNNQLQADIRAANLLSFKTLLNLAMGNQSTQIIAQLAMLTKRISKHPNFGMAVIQTLESKGHAKLNDHDLTFKGKVLLDEYFDAYRRKLADKWFYYKNTPNYGRLPLFAFNIELQAWAFWILSQKWELKAMFDTDPDTKMSLPTMYYYSNGEFELEEIMRALEDLAHEEIVDIERDGVYQGADELAAAVKLGKAASVGFSKLTDGDEGRLKQANKNKDQIFAWAKGVPGQIEHPALDYMPRTLGSISDLQAVFPGVQ
jgi:hypothetical protein